MLGRYLPLTVAVIVSASASNIDPAHALTSSDWAGALNWRPSAQSGASISQYYCSGFIYGPSIGWIALSSGTPANGISFSNNSPTDFGVNVSPAGDLTGFAYGANVGWINFAAAGQPHINFVTGKLSGAAWGANIGWIPLSSATEYLRIESLPDLPDDDFDELPDAWEISFAGGLNALSGNADMDHDGQTDFEEFRAGTDPFDAGDFLGPIRITVSVAGNALQFPTKPDHLYRVEQHPAFGSGAWSPARLQPIVGTGNTVTVQLPEDPSDQFFYRVAGFPPLSNVP